jgi:hypothetical protein
MQFIYVYLSLMHLVREPDKVACLWENHAHQVEGGDDQVDRGHPQGRGQPEDRMWLNKYILN